MASYNKFHNNCFRLVPTTGKAVVVVKLGEFTDVDGHLCT